MANNLYISDESADTALDALLALFDDGYLYIYGTPQPADANSPAGGAAVLAVLRFAATAFPASSGGVASANAITEDSDANATGTAVWFRVLQSDNATVVMDGSVGASGADMNFNTTAIQQHAVVQVTSFQVTLPEH